MVAGSAAAPTCVSGRKTKTVVISQGIAHSNVIAAWHLYLVIGGYIALLAGHRHSWLVVLSYLIDFSLFGYVVDFPTFHRFLGGVLAGATWPILGGCYGVALPVDFWGQCRRLSSLTFGLIPSLFGMGLSRGNIGGRLAH